MICINCNKEIGESLFCPYCGTKQMRSKTKVYCSECGAEMDTDAMFCKACGAKSYLAIQREKAQREIKQEGGGKSEEERISRSGSLNGHDFVDLGLSVKWATCNLGASKPEECGGYYQWAGTEDVSGMNMELIRNCPYHVGSEDDYGWVKYKPLKFRHWWSRTATPDGKYILDPEDDVAHVKLGGNWRMPTEIEFCELCKYCTSEWKSLNGVHGMMLTSKKNGNSIFFPTVGYCVDSRGIVGIQGVGECGRYWSSSLFTSQESVPCLGFGIYGINLSSNGHMGLFSQRFAGLSVRPVYK